MSAFARNMRVAAGILGHSTPVTAYVVPTGYTFIVKSLIVTNYSAASAHFYAQVHTSNYSSNVQISLTDIPAQGTHEWNGWTVLNPTDAITLVVDADNVYFWIAGALLAGFTGVPTGVTPLPA